MAKIAQRAKFLQVLRHELQARDSAIVFTQYTDTMDYLRDYLQASFGTTGVACYSGRGGELYRDHQWKIVPKEEIKTRFRNGKIDILLCTESASEGLNLQTCGVLINYDLPWNPNSQATISSYRDRHRHHHSKNSRPL